VGGPVPGRSGVHHQATIDDRYFPFPLSLITTWTFLGWTVSHIDGPAWPVLEAGKGAEAGVGHDVFFAYVACTTVGIFYDGPTNQIAGFSRLNWFSL